MREYTGPNTLLKAFQLIRQAIKSSTLSAGDGVSIQDGEINVTTPVRSILTQAEFDALTEEQRSKGLYVISDAGDVVSSGVPKGTIVIWSGTASNIPSGWALCDGQNGTPDLRGRFVLGASTAYAVGSTGGEATHTLTISEIPEHAHSVNYSSTLGSGYNSTHNQGAAVQGSFYTLKTGGSQPHNNMPPYYSLVYIMKL